MYTDMKKILTCILTVLGLNTACGQGNYENADVNEFAELVADTNVVILDVRTADEYAEGHLERAINIDYHQSDFVEKAMASLPQDKKIAVYCRSGRRSAGAAGKLGDKGYTLVNLKGGIIAWKEAGLRIISSAQAQTLPVTADSLVGEWRWVGKNVPELILVLEAGNTDPQSNGLKVESLYRYRIEDYKDPKMTFDGENIHIRKDLGENTYLELDLKPCGNDLTGRCLMVGIMPEQVDTEITFRRDYFEYDNK